MCKSIAVLLLSAVVVLVSTSAMADVWEVTAFNDTGVPVTDIELFLGGIGGGILGPLVAVNPVPAVFTAPPPLNELGANWAPLFLAPGQSFIADFDLTSGLIPSFISGTWSINAVPMFPVNPGLTTFALVPEPSSIVLAFLAAAGLSVAALRKRRTR